MLRSAILCLGCSAAVAVFGCASSNQASPSPGLDAAQADAEILAPILDGGGGVPDAPNGAALCPKGACNYQTQEGCPAQSSGPLGCQPIPAGTAGIQPTCASAGIKGTGLSCAAWTECKPGLLCVAGTCKQLCCGGDYTACPTGEHCFSSLLVQVGDAAVPSGVMLCLPAGYCNVLTDKTCPAGQSCQLVDSTGASACLAEGTGKVDDPCPCSAGFTCVLDTCRRLCLAVEGGGDPACPVAEGRCVHYDRDPPGVGECVPQMP